MSRNKKIVLVAALLVVLLVCGIIILAVFVCGKSEPEGSISTSEYSFEIHDGQLLATRGDNQNVIFETDRVGAKLTAAISPNRVYLLCDDVLYSMDADGSNQYKITSKCYNPGELSFSVADQNTTDLRTLWYYDGYVYFIKYGTTSKLCRFEVGGNDFTEICKNKVSAFTISKDGMLYGYSNTDNMGERQVTYEKDLTR